MIKVQITGSHRDDSTFYSAWLVDVTFSIDIKEFKMSW